MILSILLIILLIAGPLAWIFERWHSNAPRWVALFAVSIDLLILLNAWFLEFNIPNTTETSHWLVQVTTPWIPRFGIHYHLAIDAMSFWLILLTLFLGIISVLASWREIDKRTGFFHFNLLWTLAGVLGVFMALDLFLFFVFWEVMLVPMYFLIAIWGHERRIYSAIKFFIFTQASGLFMLVAILALVFIYYKNTGVLSFDYSILLNATLSSQLSFWLMLGFFIAFTVKLPIVPFHTWLPDAHTEAPTAGSVILAGILLKTGAYGLIRFVIPLFPDAALQFAPVAMTLGVIGIIYGGVLAFAQQDLKRLVAYTSISHMGFVILGIFAWHELALQGALIQMLAHGISTGALFVMVGQIQERLHTRDLAQMGGLWFNMPRLGALGLFFAVASLGLPGLGNFIGEIMVLMGAFQVNKLLAIFAATGVIIAAIYSLFLLHETFLGQPKAYSNKLQFLQDSNQRESILLISMAFVIVWLGIYPDLVFKTVQPVFELLQQSVDKQLASSMEVAQGISQ